MKIAIAQLNPTIGDITNNTQQIIAAATIAAQENVRLFAVILPETYYSTLGLSKRWGNKLKRWRNSYQKK
jgi:predicted amidohydrolase